MFPGLDLYYTDPAQNLTTARQKLDDLDHDLSNLYEVWKRSRTYVTSPFGTQIDQHKNSNCGIFNRPLDHGVSAPYK